MINKSFEPLSRRQPTFLLIGAAHLDRIARSSVPFMSGASNPGTVTERVGGASFNAAAALSVWGTAIRLISARGGDAAADQVEREMISHGMEDSSIVWLDRRTPTYHAVLDHEGNLIAAVADMELYDALTGRVLARRHIREAMTWADGWMFDANLPTEAIGAIIARRSNGKPLAAIAVSPSKVGRLRPHLSALSLLFLSRLEAASLIEASVPTDLIALAAALAKAGLRRAVITDGPNPAAILDETHIALQTPPTVERVRDVTGAGDTLAAITFATWAGSGDLAGAVRVGMAASSLHISDGLGADCQTRCREIAANLAPPSLHHLERC